MMGAMFSSPVTLPFVLLLLLGIAELGAPIVSIGGAGTFDGVLLTGIIATSATMTIIQVRSGEPRMRWVPWRIVS